jgi:hypothetical protein
MTGSGQVNCGFDGHFLHDMVRAASDTIQLSSTMTCMLAG